MWSCGHLKSNVVIASQVMEMDNKKINSKRNSLPGLMVMVFMLVFLQSNQVIAANDSQTFNHFSTGFPLEGVHRNVECSSCHLYGIFSGISSSCTSCHSKSSRISATFKPPSHIETTEACDSFIYLIAGQRSLELITAR